MERQNVGLGFGTDSVRLRNRYFWRQVDCCSVGSSHSRPSPMQYICVAQITGDLHKSNQILQKKSSTNILH